MKNGIEHTHEDDYLAAPEGTEITHVLVDLHKQGVIETEVFGVNEKEKRNKAARKAGKTSFWCPALYKL